VGGEEEYKEEEEKGEMYKIKEGQVVEDRENREMYGKKKSLILKGNNIKSNKQNNRNRGKEKETSGVLEDGVCKKLNK
jgi:hypothetical protein